MPRWDPGPGGLHGTHGWCPAPSTTGQLPGAQPRSPRPPTPPVALESHCVWPSTLCDPAKQPAATGPSAGTQQAPPSASRHRVDTSSAHTARTPTPGSWPRGPRPEHHGLLSLCPALRTAGPQAPHFRQPASACQRLPLSFTPQLLSPPQSPSLVASKTESPPKCDNCTPSASILAGSVRTGRTPSRL